MAVFQKYNAPAGKRAVALIERPVEPGRARQFWDGSKGQWSDDAAARVEAVADPHFPEIYLVSIPTELTRDWPDQLYWCTGLDADWNPRVPWDQVLWNQPFVVAFGDDGTNPYPSADLATPDGRIVHLLNAYTRP